MMNDHRDDRKKVRGNDATVKIDSGMLLNFEEH